MQVIRDTQQSAAFHRRFNYSHPPDQAGVLGWALEVHQRHTDRSRFPNAYNLWGDATGRTTAYQPELGREAEAYDDAFSTPYRGAKTITTGHALPQRVTIDAPAVNIHRPGIFPAFVLRR